MADDPNVPTIIAAAILGVVALIGAGAAVWWYSWGPGSKPPPPAYSESDGHREYEFKAIQGLYGDDSGSLTNRETITFTGRRGQVRTITIDREVH